MMHPRTRPSSSAVADSITPIPLPLVSNLASDLAETPQQHVTVAPKRLDSMLAPTRGRSEPRGKLIVGQQLGSSRRIIRRTTHAPPRDVNAGYERFTWATIRREVGGDEALEKAGDPKGT